MTHMTGARITTVTRARAYGTNQITCQTRHERVASLIEGGTPGG